MAFEGRRRRYLPVELQENIQNRLPTKSLVRLQSVCKTWQSRFADLFHLLRGGFHRSDLPKEDLYSMVPGLRDPPLHPLPSAPHPWEPHDTVLGGSTILCLISLHRSLDNVYIMHRHSISSAKFALLNPVTGNHIFTNPIPPQFSSIVPLSEPSEIVFGFGALNSDYRIVVIVRYGPDLTSSLVLLYSLISGEWKKMNFVIPQETTILDIFCSDYGRAGELFRECFVSGCWHWMLRLDDRTYRVLSFNFSEEEFRLIGMPEPQGAKLPKHQECKTLALQGRLAVIDMVCRGPNVERLDVWVMTEYGVEESWSRVYRMEPPLMHGMVKHILRIDCRKDATAAAGFVVGSLFIGTFTLKGHKIICCDDDGYREVDGFRTKVEDARIVQDVDSLKETEQLEENTNVGSRGNRTGGRAGKRRRRKKQRR